MYEPSTFVTVPLETTYPFEQYGNEGLQEATNGLELRIIFKMSW
jgi:hypothetical protein